MKSPLASRRLAAALFAGCALFSLPLAAPLSAQPGPDATANLDAILWMQKSPEYALAAVGQWRALEDQLPRLKRGGEALVPSEVPQNRARRLAPAIIVDLDETVIDNAPANAQAASGLPFDEARWQEWLTRVDEQFAVPGAVQALRRAADMGFRVFYISNRECPADSAPAAFPHPDCPARTATMAVLKRLGLPFADDPAALLLRHDQQGWREKTDRRQHVARAYRVAALVGDDIGDFLPRDEAEGLIDSIGRSATIAQRMAQPQGALAKLVADHAGRDWFMIPNPAYGSWERGQGSRIACTNPRLSGEACAEAALAAKQGRLVLPGGAQRLRLATWNIEWLMPAEVRDGLLAACVEGQPASNQRAVPCPRDPYPPVARHDADDIARLAQYAARARADVVAVQEVDGPDAAAAVFPGYTFACFIDRAHPQKTGFAIRTGIPHRCNGDLAALDTDGASRAGADMTLWPDTPHALRLLSVHLKSGCFEAPLSNPQGSERQKAACASFKAQVPVLARWAAERQAAGEPFAIMGDFNRRLEIDAALPAPDSLWAALAAAAPVARISEGEAYRPCRAGDNYTAYIDHVILGGALADLRRDFVHIAMTSEPEDAVLSDHCLLGADLWAWPGTRGDN
ncbi:MAG: 5'-nucleotidase, lipoprotein e(P4) family [Erythrobacter sp.]